MAKSKNICCKCNRVITGKIKIITRRKKVGSKSIVKMEMYDEKCFKLKSREKAINEYSKKKRRCKNCD